ncbi:ankyrin repeat and zinc finger domain-containing protein 1 [Spea bombifrons]|uniref:ankyrin repeat and zinc finger domain-containing protein 1 n=1 Tax=Spea bombifrons TaxID=233779 RepID=UPI00234AC60C|nr:ankyrin repeat and zinc finger domain-containing protein 1 [Spea bombifrons]
MEGSPSVQTFSLFDLGVESPVLSGLSLYSSNGRVEIQDDLKPSEIKLGETKVLEISDRLSCSACQCAFDSREEQREHYTLDWHRFNLKRRIKGAVPLSAEDFQEKTRAGDVSSISGSDSESSDDDDGGGLDVSPGPDADPDPIPGPSRRSQRCFFRNGHKQLLSVYRCMLGKSKDSDLEPEQLLSCVKSMQEQPLVVILMAGGGHFAGAVYKGKEVLKHKTFHRYTVRAKRGTSQAVHDSQNRSHMPKSAGAALRRYNQAALITDITQLLQSWAAEVNEARCILVRAPRSDRTLFLGRNSPISRKDPRVHSVPFVTRRATFREVQRVHAQLFTLQVFEKDIPLSLVSGPRIKVTKPRKPVRTETKEERTDSPDLSEEEEPVTEHLITEELTLSTLDLREYELQPKRKRKKKKKKDVEITESGNAALNIPDASCAANYSDFTRVVRTETLSAVFLVGDEVGRARNALFTCCKTGDSETAKQILQDLPSSTSQTSAAKPAVGALGNLVNERLPIEGRTLLHVAASAGHGEVACLLMDAGWDPALRDSAGRTPYSLCADKVTRSLLRKYREDKPERYNYSKSQIPEPISEEAETQRAKKKQAQRAQKKQREKEEKEERKRREEEEAEKKRFAALSDREKRAMAAERRLAAQLNTTKAMEIQGRRCWLCGESLLGKVPFEYLDFSFCSTRCLQEHRRSSAAK